MEGMEIIMKISCSDFGVLSTGEQSHLYHLENTSGAYIEVTDYGCRIVKIAVPDREGRLIDICLGYDTIDDYEADTHSFGAVVGRVANRIREGRFTLNGKDYQLAINNGPNHLHGGIVGYAARLWQGSISDDSLLLTLCSPNGEEGYPGNVLVSVRYSWSDDNELSILYEATSDEDTPFNITNHAYFNLDGHGAGSVLPHDLFVDSDFITELDSTQIPTGNMIPVSGTPFDFRMMHRIGKFIDSDHEQIHQFGTYDHNFVINGTGLREAAVLQSIESGIRMTCFTDQPGIQLYVANHTITTHGKNGRPYSGFTSVCLETQHFPDSVNHADFPSVILHPNDPFRSKTIYNFSTF
jgi:aldose 1-epimerase